VVLPVNGEMVMEGQSVRQLVSEEEWALRKDLAAAYNAAALLRMTDHIYSHFSARVPGTADEFLINAYGLTFDEITASSLVKVNGKGDVLLDTTGLGINPAGFNIHSAIHLKRHDAVCVMHTHTAAGIAVSAQEHGLLMISQHALRFYEGLAYHDYHGVVLDAEEQPVLLESLGDSNAMILRNHGFLVCGKDVPDAFDALYYLERACQAQIAAMSGGAKLVVAPEHIAKRTAAQFANPNRASRLKHWAPTLRMVERANPACFT
jgi:ribulose-5-phosphate 4-epimerase/fuculose-1-phosphate aldolase